jgi:flavorubredoxin
MSLLSLKQNYIRYFQNLQGWKTKRKIILIESDDWGCIRMPSSKVFNELKEKGLNVDLFPYSKYDTIENKDDFDALFDILKSFKDLMAIILLLLPIPL